MEFGYNPNRSFLSDLNFEMVKLPFQKNIKGSMTDMYHEIYGCFIYVYLHCGHTRLQDFAFGLPVH